MDPRDFGERIRERREFLGLHQRTIANALNTDQGKISLIEKGLRKLDVLSDLPALARILQVTPNWFYPEFENVLDEPVSCEIKMLNGNTWFLLKRAEK